MSDVNGTSRRHFLAGAALVGGAVVGASALAACGDDSGDKLTERQQTLFIAGCDSVYTIPLKIRGIVPANTVKK